VTIDKISGKKLILRYVNAIPAAVGKVFETTLLAQAVLRWELGLDDPAAKYVVELQRGGEFANITAVDRRTSFDFIQEFGFVLRGLQSRIVSSCITTIVAFAPSKT
jgi:hypothetical protein